MKDLLLRMLSKLTGAYSKNPDSVIGRLFQIYAMALGGVEDTMRTIALWHNIDNAKGRTLDRLGRNFGVERDGASDAFYRLIIKLKVTSLLSGGDIDTLITAMATLFNAELERVEVLEIYPAKCMVILYEADIAPEYVMEAKRTAQFIKRIMAAGIGLLFGLKIAGSPFRETPGHLALHLFGISIPFPMLCARIPVRFDGGVCFNGTALFNQVYSGAALTKVAFGVPFRKSRALTGMLIRDAGQTFGGDFRFDGSQLFDSNYLQEVL